MDDPGLDDDSAVDVRGSAHGVGRDVGAKGVERLAGLFYTFQFPIGTEVFFSWREDCASAKE